MFSKRRGIEKRVVGRTESNSRGSGKGRRRRDKETVRLDERVNRSRKFLNERTLAGVAQRMGEEGLR